MIFKEYDPIKRKMLQVIDNNGKLINEKYMPEISDEEILESYKSMLFARTADLMIVNYQRQGRIFTYPPNYGQEAISGAAGRLIREEDWLVPAFREMGAYLSKGASLIEIFLYFMGYEDGVNFENAKNFLPYSVPIASQLPHAVGIGYEIKYRKKDQLVYTFVGDGGTSEGDFHESLNFAGVWKVPVIFIVQNNQYGISTPFSMQTASDGIAIKSVAYGIKGIQVDGNDFFAMYKAIKESADYARKEQAPVLIEAITYRKGAHTTSDDPSKYRTKEEEEKWEPKDPLNRLKAFLKAKKLWTEKDEENILEEYRKEVDRQFSEAEKYGPVKLEDVFKFTYGEMPQDLKNQMMEHEKFLKWKEARS